MPTAQPHSNFDDDTTHEMPLRSTGGSRGVSGTLVLIVLLVLAACLGAAYLFHYRPMLEQLADLEGRVAQAEDTAARVPRLEAENAALAEERDGLRAELDVLRDREGELSELVEQREEEIAELRAAQDRITEDLDAEIRRGDVIVTGAPGELAVGLANQILFAPGQAELTPRGEAVLRRVADTLKRVDRVIQVAGHTDSQPLSAELQETFPTNWELSTARATNVVRFLEDECEVPGDRLMAAGFSHYRPVASNASPRGRLRNRRIELALRRAPVVPVETRAEHDRDR